MNPSPMALLASGIPLTLLMDLVCGPHSSELLDEEHQHDWTPDVA